MPANFAANPADLIRFLPEIILIVMGTLLMVLDPLLQARVDALHAESAAQEAETGRWFAERGQRGELSWDGFDERSHRFMADKLVALEPAKGGRAIRYFIGPRAGGMELTVEERSILVLTPQSPLGRHLIGKRVGDTVSAAGRGASVMMRIVAVE